MPQSLSRDLKVESNAITRKMLSQSMLHWKMESLNWLPTQTISPTQPAPRVRTPELRWHLRTLIASSRVTLLNSKGLSRYLRVFRLLSLFSKSNVGTTLSPSQLKPPSCLTSTMENSRSTTAPTPSPSWQTSMDSGLDSRSCSEAPRRRSMSTMETNLNTRSHTIRMVRPVTTTSSLGHMAET